jgi:hypothetical protein
VRGVVQSDPASPHELKAWQKWGVHVRDC